MKMDDRLGFTREHLEEFLASVDIDLHDEIRSAYNAGDAESVSRSMIRAVVVMGQREEFGQSQRHMH